MSGWSREARVESGNHEQVQDRRGDEATHNDHGHRMHDLEPGDVAQEQQGQESDADGCHTHYGGSELLPRAVQDKLRTDGFPLVLLERPAGADQHDGYLLRKQMLVIVVPALSELRPVTPAYPFAS